MLENIEALQRNDFQGFMPVQELQATRCRAMPAEAGVYLVVRNDETLPTFLVESIGGHFKGKDPTVSIDELKAKWVDHAIILNIGKADNLQNRVKQYMDFGLGKRTAHHGGRYIWQLSNSHALQLCWKTTPYQNPKIEENRLLESFYIEHSALPFANLRF